MVFIKLLTLIILISVTCSFSQVDFLLDGPSTESGAEFSAYSALPNSDPMGYYYNPAQLGVFAKRNTIAFSYPNYNDLGRVGENSGWYSTSLNVSSGWIYEEVAQNLDIAIGIGYMRYVFDYSGILQPDESGTTNNKIDGYEQYNVAAVGLTLNYYASLSIGFGLKSISSNLHVTNDNSTVASDFGLLLSTPFFDIPMLNSNHTLNFNIGYVRLNNGRGLRLAEGRDPLPKEEIIGYSVVYEFSKMIKKKKTNPFSLSYSSEAHNPLYESRVVQNYNTNINFIKHVLKLEYEKDIYIKRTLRLDFFDWIFSYSLHRIKAGKESLSESYAANTFTLSLTKLLLAMSYQQNPVLKEIDLRFALTTSNKNTNAYMYGLTAEITSINIIMDLFE